MYMIIIAFAYINNLILIIIYYRKIQVNDVLNPHASLFDFNHPNLK